MATPRPLFLWQTVSEVSHPDPRNRARHFRKYARQKRSGGYPATISARRFEDRQTRSIALGSKRRDRTSRLPNRRIVAIEMQCVSHPVKYAHHCRRAWKRSACRPEQQPLSGWQDQAATRCRDGEPERMPVDFRGAQPTMIPHPARTITSPVFHPRAGLAKESDPSCRAKTGRPLTTRFPKNLLTTLRPPLRELLFHPGSVRRFWPALPSLNMLKPDVSRLARKLAARCSRKDERAPALHVLRSSPRSPGEY